LTQKSPDFDPELTPKSSGNFLRMRDLSAIEIKLRRIALGWRQQDLAARVGISTTRLSAIERGERKPGLDEVKSLAAALYLSLHTEIIVSDACLAKGSQSTAKH
jgi:transcriptional regulator with XRE-family HTH domain